MFIYNEQWPNGSVNVVVSLLLSMVKDMVWILNTNKATSHICYAVSFVNILSK